MSEKTSKHGTKLDYLVQFINETQVVDEVGDAVASILLNPLVTWAKFVLTDDMPNGNGQRVPVEEFENLIKSGLHMPVKMAEGKIEQGHEDSKPLGVIAHLKKDVLDGKNVLIALAALWPEERPADVDHLKSLMESGEDVNVSWELKYRNSVITSDGIENLYDTKMKAATIVSRPAYKGRTRFLAIASAEDWSQPFVENLPDTSFLYIESGKDKDSEGRTPKESRHFAYKDSKGKISFSRLQSILDNEIPNSKLDNNILAPIKENAKALLDNMGSGTESAGENFLSENNNMEDSTVNIEELTQQLKESNDKLAVATSQLQEKDQELTNVKASLETLEGEKKVLETELDGLREYKETAEAKVAEAGKLESIKAKFSDAGIVKEDAYFVDNKDKLLGLEDAELDFLVQELVSFAKTGEASASHKSKIPNIPGEKPSTNSITELAKALRERKAK